MKIAEIVLSKKIHSVEFSVSKRAHDLLKSHYENLLHDKYYDITDFSFEKSIQNDLKNSIAKMWAEYHSPKIQYNWQQSCKREKDLPMPIDTEVDQLTLHCLLFMKRRFERVGSNCGKCYIGVGDIISSAIKNFLG